MSKRTSLHRHPKRGGRTPRQIRGALILRGVKQVDIAKQIGKSKATISSTIAGRRKDHVVRTAIAAAMGLPYNAVWGMPSRKGRKAA